MTCLTFMTYLTFLNTRPCLCFSGKGNKELPPNFGKAKVKEFVIGKIFCRIFYAENQKKKTPWEVLKNLIS